MASITKSTYQQACSLNANHVARDENDRLTHSNKDIDSSRTHDNYSLLDRNMNDRQRLKQRLEEVAHINRKDLIASADMLITVPKEVPQKFHKQFFEECVKWAQARYGEKNIWQARVHMDESQPHLHMGIVPTLEATKLQKTKGFSERLSFDERFSKRHDGANEYMLYHRSLQEHMQKTGIPGADKVLNGATKDGNRSVREMKAEREHAHELSRDDNPFRRQPSERGRDNGYHR